MRISITFPFSIVDFFFNVYAIWFYTAIVFKTGPQHFEKLAIGSRALVWAFSWTAQSVHVCGLVTSVVSDSLQPHGLCNLPASSVHKILQARILEWVAMPSSRGSSQPRGRTCVSYVSCIIKRVSTSATEEAPQHLIFCKGRDQKAAILGQL